MVKSLKSRKLSFKRYDERDSSKKKTFSIGNISKDAEDGNLYALKAMFDRVLVTTIIQTNLVDTFTMADE